MRKLILSLAVLAVGAGAADAGPLRNLAQRIRGGGCAGGGCQPTAAPVQYQPAAPPLVMPATGQTVHLTSYVREPAGVPAGQVAGWEPYQPIRVGSPVPVCPTCPK